MPLAVELRDVTFAYGRGRPVLEHVSLAVRPGEFLAIAGPNGGGKTTLMRLVLGLERPSRGEARLFGEPAHAFSRCDLGTRAASQLTGDAPKTCASRGAGVWPAHGARALPRDREAIAMAIERVGLADHAGTPLGRLSGGEQQRAFIAKALASEPSLLVLDEPTTGVDVEAQDALAALLEQLHKTLEVTILYVSHEFGAVERFVDRLVLVRGGIVFDGPPEELPDLWHDPSHAHA